MYDLVVYSLPQRLAQYMLAREMLIERKGSQIRRLFPGNRSSLALPLAVPGLHLLAVTFIPVLVVLVSIFRLTLIPTLPCRPHEEAGFVVGTHVVGRVG